MPGSERGPDVKIWTRVPSTSISLKSLEESMTKFPICAETANRCCDAWNEGQKAAKFVFCRPLVPDTDSSHADFKYIFYDTGRKPKRTRQEVHRLESSNAFVVNREICHVLEQTFQTEATETLAWLHDLTADSYEVENGISNFKMQDITKINAFTVFQAFFMGYWYGLFLPLVDPSTLQLQTVEGEWGFRSPTFLCTMRALYVSTDTAHEPGIRMLNREDVLSILSALLLNSMQAISRDSYNRDNWCLGVVEKRALLTRSLIKPCRTLPEIGSFVLLDADVSGIPVNVEGLVRPGVPDQQRNALSETSDELREVWPATSSQHSDSKTEDATFHIEADWDGNPENLLLCVRYKGKRVETINPGTADVAFLRCLVTPIPEPLRTSTSSSKDWLSRTRIWTMTDSLRNRPPPPLPVDAPLSPLLISLPGQPRLRYFAAEIYNARAIVRIATNCTITAIQDCVRTAESERYRQLFTITGTEAGSIPLIEDWLPEEVNKRLTCCI